MEQRELTFDLQAFQILTMIRDLGHLSDHQLDMVTAQIADMINCSGGELAPDGVIRAELVRPVAARMLFEGEAEMSPEQQRLLQEEWKALFG